MAVAGHAYDEQLVAKEAAHQTKFTLLANASPTLSQNGARTDLQLRADYVPLKDGGKPGEKEDWSLYGFVQGTVERTEEFVWRLLQRLDLRPLDELAMFEYGFDAGLHIAVDTGVLGLQVDELHSDRLGEHLAVSC